MTPVDSLWSYLHRAFGTWDNGRRVAEKYRRGEISYQEWAETDAALWAGMAASEFTNVLTQIPYRSGATELFRELRQRQIKTAILSAGLSILADRAAKDLGADFALSNELEMNDGVLTGGIKVKVAVDRKGSIVEDIARQFSIPLEQVALVGDRENDLDHQKCLRIAFMPKDQRARKCAHHVVVEDDLRKVIEYLI